MQEKRVVEKQCEYQRALLELQEKLKITLNQVNSFYMKNLKSTCT